MNDSSNSLPPSGDDALEARIVAWVLGEASPFEAAELEKLCAENPKLREFERRMRDLNEILEADAKPGDDAAWKLSAGKREKVMDLLGVAADDEAERKVNRYFARRILLAAAACVAISLVSYPLFSGGILKSRKSVVAESARSVDFMADAPPTAARSPAYSAEVQGDEIRRQRVGRQGQGAVESLIAQGEFESGQRGMEQMKRKLGSDEIAERTVEDRIALHDSPLPASPAVPPAATAMPAEPAMDIAKQGMADAAGKKSDADAKPSDPADLYYRGWLENRAGERLKEQGNIAGAQTKLADARDKFQRVQQEHPGWKKDMVEGRLEKTEEQLAQVGDGGAELASRSELAPLAEAKSAAAAAEAKNQEVPSLAKPMTAVPSPQVAGEGAGGTDVAGIVTGGLRSGDAQVNRNNIDAILNHPQGPAVPGQTPAGKDAPADIPASGGVAGAGAIAGQGTAMERGDTGLHSDAAKGGPERDLAADISGASANEFALQLGPEDPLAYRFRRQELVPRKPGEMPVQESGAPDGFALSYDSSALGAIDANSSSAGAWFGLMPGNSRALPYAGVAPAGGGDRSELAAAEKFFFGNASAAPASGFSSGDREAVEPPHLALGGVLSQRQSQVPAGSLLSPAMPLQLDQDSDKSVAERSTAQDTANGDAVRRNLYQAEGAYNLGKYDDAFRAYEDVIRVDPYNKAARQGMERVTQARTDYYRAAYDHTRAQLLSEVDAAWDVQVPPVVATQPAAGPKADDDLSELAKKEVARRQETVSEADRFVEEGRKARESGDLEKAYKMHIDGLDLMPEAPAAEARRSEVKRSLGEIAAGLAVDAETKGKKDAAKEWAGRALQWNPEQKAAKEILDLGGGDETSATAEPFSTFSLHVSDASFKLAKAALDRGEQPDPAGIRAEEFYNAFDYGDPAPAQGEPVVCVTEQAAHPILPQRNLLRIGVRTGSAGRGGSTPLNLTLLLDSSGSMEREDRQAAMLRAVDQLSKLLKEGDTVTVAGFARQPRLLADRLPGARAQELNTIIAQTPSEGGTNLEEGLKLAEELAKRQFNGAAQNRIVLFTDGAANLGDAQPESLQARVEQLRQQGIAFDAAGFGAEGLNDRLLERLTRNGNGRYYVVDRAEDAGEGFAKQLAGAFRPAAENVKVQVRFNAARVARYKLFGFEEHRLAKEDFKNDAVDAAEMAAEEAGNALYQIQALPEGEGEIGEVSVRFRDVASGQMVERTWTIPYEAQVPAFDQAAPSMQLAGLAMFAAEKLRKAPMADAIDFEQLGKVMVPVKAKYAGSVVVEELGGMIERLK